MLSQENQIPLDNDPSAERAESMSRPGPHSLGTFQASFSLGPHNLCFQPQVEFRQVKDGDRALELDDLGEEFLRKINTKWSPETCQIPLMINCRLEMTPKFSDII